MRHLWAAACGALLLTACGQDGARAPERASDTLRVAAWNIEHLTAETGAGCAPRDEAALDLVADYIAAVDADVWLLQEIDGEAALERVFGEGWSFHVEEREAVGEYPLCRGRDDGSRLRAQNTAVAVRDGVAHSRIPDLDALDVAGAGRMRHGVAVTVFDNEPIDLMSLHLASGCHEGEESNVCPTLFSQIEVLEGWIDTRSAMGRAVIVGGDFNRRLELDADLVWSELNDGDPYPLHVAGPGIRPQCDPRYGEFIDFLILNNHAQGRKIQGSFHETTYGRGDRPSDHCPILIDLRR
ncbi:MAG TPA: endonuclease/exonuclease/phosphatase [Oceanicaulis sp.]|jgi:endonuclease/exonuclease/phosphatase family metal-dependent hydrolase|uniref:Endonuclease/exonuclease/phosphatase family protein n=1 Tax=Glycocaulis abyssi TaxID=1433403 RepID=A0ABV9NDT0_9PROT|nr:endonuclease/exonuclease/phosphatase [Glycocaulis profundi]HCY54833.1 endonuclease/exonuclease/phosphatase [Oceanicaulis sp.]